MSAGRRGVPLTKHRSFQLARVKLLPCTVTAHRTIYHVYNMNAKPVNNDGDGQTSEPLRKRVLLVDDDLSVRKSIGSVLQDAGYEVFQSGDGVDALAHFDARQIDLLLLDLGLPNQSGWDTFEAFTSQNPMLPTIIITGQARQSGMAMAAGAGALMEKPLDVAQLLQTMQELLSEPEEARLRRLNGYNGDGRYVSRYILPAGK
jgi:CheY-like chemotaxis protein